VAETPSDLSSTITFTDPKAEELARGLYRTLGSSGLVISAPAHEPPADALLGTPEVIVTLFLATAGRAVLLASLGALEKYLETKIADEGSKRIQIILVGHEEELPKRFPISLRGISSDALHIFITRLRTAIEKF
jgi:hypothetical protein